MECMRQCKCVFDASPSPSSSPAVSRPSPGIKKIVESVCNNFFFWFYGDNAQIRLGQIRLYVLFLLSTFRCGSAERCNPNQIGHCFQLNKSAKQFKSSKRTTSDKNQKRKANHNRKYKMCKT